MKANVESQTFNGLVEWRLEGDYIKLLTAAANLRLECYLEGRLVLLAPAVKRGFYQRVKMDQVKITNTGSQLVEFLVAPEEGGSDALTGSFDITSPLLGDNADDVPNSGAASLVGTIGRLMAFDGATWDRLRAVTIDGVISLAVVCAGTLGRLRQLTINGYHSLVTHDANDGFADRVVLQDEAFYGPPTSAASVGNYSHVQLKNPSGSGKILYLDKITAWGSGGWTAADLSIRRHDTNLTTAIGGGTNKSLGGAGAVGLLKSEQNAAVLGTGIVTHVTLANYVQVVTFNPSLRMSEGVGVAAVYQGTNTGIFATFEWREKST